MSDYLEVAVAAARKAAEIQMTYLGRSRVDYKTGLNDLVTEADRLCEEAVRNVIMARFADHDFLGEEGGRSGGAKSEFRWFVDPIDGTTNYAHGIPLFAVSIGLADREGLRVGVVYAPALGELFTAERGGGAFLNGKPLAVSRTPRMQEGLLATGFPYRLGQGNPRNLNHFRHLTTRSRGVRRLGSAALDLAWVAAGRLDAYWEIELSPWDMAAGALLVTEAGGTVTRVSGMPFSLEAGDVVASNGLIHQEVLAALRESADPSEAALFPQGVPGGGPVR